MAILITIRLYLIKMWKFDNVIRLYYFLLKRHTQSKPRFQTKNTLSRIFWILNEDFHKYPFVLYILNSQILKCIPATFIWRKNNV